MWRYLRECACDGRLLMAQPGLVLILGVAACAGTVVHVTPEPLEESVTQRAEWEHALEISSRLESPRGVVVTSMISDRTPTVRYAVAIRVQSIGVTYVAEQDSPDGHEREVLEIRLRAGDAPDTFYVDFDHSVDRDGERVLRFCGTTVLPRSRE